MKSNDIKYEKTLILNDSLIYFEHLCFDFCKNKSVYKKDLQELGKRIEVIQEAFNSINKIVSDLKLLDSLP